MQERVREAAAEFLVRESNGQSLITVTAARVDERGQHATIFITVLPDSQEEKALEFANRNKQEFGMFLLKRVRGMRIQDLRSNKTINDNVKSGDMRLITPGSGRIARARFNSGSASTYFPSL